MTERGAVEVLQAATDRMAGVPFTVLAGQGDLPGVLGRAWLEGAFTAVGITLEVQRRTLEQTLAAQQDLLQRFAEAGSVLARTASPRPPQ